NKSDVVVCMFLLSLRALPLADAPSGFRSPEHVRRLQVRSCTRNVTRLHLHCYPSAGVTPRMPLFPFRALLPTWQSNLLESLICKQVARSLEEEWRWFLSEDESLFPAPSRSSSPLREQREQQSSGQLYGPRR